MKIPMLAALLLSFATSAYAGRFEDGRKLYAIGSAAEEFCPGVTFGYVAQSSINQVFQYRPPGDDKEFSMMNAEKQNMLKVFNRGGNRPAVCEYIMSKYGPGGEFHLLDFE